MCQSDQQENLNSISLCIKVFLHTEIRYTPDMTLFNARVKQYPASSLSYMGHDLKRNRKHKKKGKIICRLRYFASSDL